MLGHFLGVVSNAEICQQGKTSQLVNSCKSIKDLNAIFNLYELHKSEILARFLRIKSSTVKQGKVTEIASSIKMGPEVRQFGQKELLRVRDMGLTYAIAKDRAYNLPIVDALVESDRAYSSIAAHFTITDGLGGVSGQAYS